MAIKIGDLFLSISANNSKLRANLAEASSLIRDWSLLVTGLTSGITHAFRMIADVGIKAVQIGLVALSASFAAAAKVGADFEDAMVRTFTILREGSDNAGLSFSSLTSKARLLGRETLFSATDAAEGMQVLAKAGFNTREILDSIGPVLNLAIVGNLQLGEAATFAISALRGFNLESREATRVTDVLALASSKANTDIQLLGSALSFVAPVAAGAGLSLEETAAAIGLLSNAGIRGSRAGTSLRRAITQLIAPTGGAKKVFNELGVSVVDSSGKVKPLTTVVRELNAAGITAAQTMEAFGLRAGPGMIALLKAGSGALSSFQSDLEDADGAANRMAQNFRTTVAGRTKDLIASLVDLGLAFSEEFKKPLADTIFAVRNFIKDIVTAGEQTGLFRSIVKGVQDALSPLRDVLAALSKRFIEFLKDLTAEDVLSFFDSMKRRLQDIITSVTSGEIKETLTSTFTVVMTLIEGINAIVGILLKGFMLIPDSIRPTVTALGLVSSGIISLFGGVLNLVILFISLNALTTALGAKIGFTAALSQNLRIVWLLLLGIAKGILVAFAGVALILGAITIGRLIGEMETWGALVDSIIARWDRVVAGIKEAIAQAKLFIKSSDENADAVVAAREEKAKAQRNIEESDRKLREAAERDRQKQDDLFKDPIAGMKQALQETFQDMGKIFESSFKSAMDNALGTPRAQAGATGGGLLNIGVGGELFQFTDQEIEKQNQEFQSKADAMVKAMEANNVQRKVFTDSIDAAIDEVLKEKRILADALIEIANKQKALRRRAILPSQDEITKPAPGATFEQ